ncbi:FAD-dependent monooxygenase [Dactylosporangium sp. CS-047395]|uniref:FAD-dependent monooxygenase n=1 Tax=Dactylosporangium sp. CS-047395 TaxID=3239936 RepID=UPI003D91B0FF
MRCVLHLVAHDGVPVPGFGRKITQRTRRCRDQGQEQLIHDAYNLGWKLAAVAHGAPESLLNTYEAERRPVAAGVLALSDARLKQAIEERGIPTQREGVQAVRAEPGSDLAAAYGANARTVVLIRPDGYLGMISDAGDLSAVSDYLAAIGGAVH